MVLQHNLAAEGAVRQYGMVNSKRSKNTERLSTGYKINRAADDAANLSISEKMRMQIRGLNKATENAQDGISLLQIADGALAEDHQMVQRIRELAVKAANGTNTDADREAIQAEIGSLVKEIDRIADSTEYNTMSLLDGSFASGSAAAFRTPLSYSNAGQMPVTVQTGNNSINAGGAIIMNPVISGTGVSPAQAATLNTELGNSIVPHAVDAFLNTFSVFNNASGAGQLSNQIGLNLYSDNSSTLAYVAMQYSYQGDGTILDNSIQLNLSVNVGALQFDSSNKLTASSRTALETTIIHEMMHAFMDDVLTNGMIGATDGKIDKSNQFPGWFKEGMAQAAAGGCANSNDWVNGGLGLNASSSGAKISSTVKSESNKLASGSTSSQYGTGYLACMYLGYLAAGKPATLNASTLAGGLNTVFQKLVDGDTLIDVIKDVSGGAYKSIYDFEKKFGDAASTQFISDLLAAVGNVGSGGVVNASNSLTADDLLPDTNTTATAYQVDPTRAFVPSSVGGNRNWKSGGSGGYTGPGDPMYLQVGFRSDHWMKIQIEDAHAATLGLSSISVLNEESAREAITACDGAIDKISANRSQIGAYVNRLEHTINNLQVNSENTQAAESLIRDTDMAKEMVEYTKNNILAQVGESMIAQANQSKQQILSLLQ